MKYKLINIKTKEEHLCDKITIDGFDYYVSNNPLGEGDVFKCTQVIDEVHYLALQEYPENLIPWDKNQFDDLNEPHRNIWKSGYNKSQETHPYSEEDMIVFAEWLNWNTDNPKGLLKLWKAQQPKILYYQ